MQCWCVYYAHPQVQGEVPKAWTKWVEDAASTTADSHGTGMTGSAVAEKDAVDADMMDLSSPRMHDLASASRDFPVRTKADRSEGSIAEEPVAVSVQPGDSLTVTRPQTFHNSLGHSLPVRHPSVCPYM
jgi:plastocyanin